MSLLLLIDGYNVIPPVAPPGRRPQPDWLHRERMQLVARLAEHLEEPIRRRTCVVFDSNQPPPDRPARFEMEGMDVWFAVQYPEADDLLEEIIAAHSAPKQLAVVSSDHRVQTAARRRGATSFDSQPWFDHLLNGSVLLSPAAKRVRRRAGQGSSESKPVADDIDVDRWMDEFGF